MDMFLGWRLFPGFFSLETNMSLCFFATCSIQSEGLGGLQIPHDHSTAFNNREKNKLSGQISNEKEVSILPTFWCQMLSGMSQLGPKYSWLSLTFLQTHPEF
jgi:hypothetical protein